MMRHRASKMNGQSQLSATPIKPLQSHLPSLQHTSSFFGSSFFSGYNSTLDRNHGNCGSPDGNLAAQHASWTTTMTFRVLQYEIDLLANLVVSSGIFECYLTLPLQTSSPNLSCALWPNRLALVAHRNLSIPELHQIAAFVSERSRQSQPFTNQPMATSLGLFMLGSYVQVRSAPHLLLHSIAQGFAARQWNHHLRNRTIFIPLDHPQGFGIFRGSKRTI